MILTGEDEPIYDDYVPSDEDGEDLEEQYTKLHDAVSQLESFKRIRPATRKEAASLISEFNVNKKETTHVQAKDLAGVLEKKKLKETKLNKKAKKVTSVLKTLPTPLEKPKADLIQRRIGYEIVKGQLQRWNAVIENHRVADHISFPLNEPSVAITSDKKFFNNFVTKTDLEKELDAVLHKEDQEVEREKSNPEEEDEDFPLTMQELMERRKEMAGIRARQSYREAKAFRQSKIKSKKYHRMMKRDKIKKEIKEFEILQKTDPEAALKKLEELEKTRAEERASLKHRSTGKWAKNLTVRAKYDQESRKVLAEQLSISRQATQKLKTADSSDEEWEAVGKNEPDPSVLKSAIDIAESNPWSLEVTPEVNSFITGFRKYWTEQNKSLTVADAVKPVTAEASTDSKTVSKPPPEKEKKKSSKTNKKSPTKKLDSWTVSPVVGEPTPLRPTRPANFNIDDAFYLADAKLAQNITKKFKVLSDKIKAGDKMIAKKKTKRRGNSLPDAPLKKSRWQVERVEVDAELGNMDLEDAEKPRNQFEISEEVVDTSSDKAPVKPSALNIDPEKFLTVKKKTLDTSIPEDMLAGDEEGLEDQEQQQLIMEAFAEDNVADFREAKEEAEKETAVPEVVPELPGWGSWGGQGVQQSTRKRRRFMKMPKLPDRKDKKLRDIIINENPNQKIKNHMVKELPFPFTSVEAFEAQLRAPISREWLPETVHRQLIKPAIHVKKGAIIEPLGEDVLLRVEAKARSVFRAKKKANSKK